MKILIVGYGSIGERHHRVLKSLYPNAAFTICSRRTFPQLNVIHSLQETDLNLYDYFVIASETSKHFNDLKTIDSVVRNKKILVEKPLFELATDYHQNNQVFVGYNMRFNPMIQHLKSFLEGKKTYSINVIAGQYLPDWRPQRDYRLSYSAQKAKGGGVFLDLSHEIDYLQWLWGSFEPKAFVEREGNVLEMDSQEHVCLIATNEQKTILNCTLSYLYKVPQRKIIVETNAGTIELDLINFRVTKVENSSPVSYDIPKVDRDYSYTLMHQDILQNSPTTTCSYREGADVLRFIEKSTRLKGKD